MVKKRIFSILLSCVLLLCVSTPVFASYDSSYQIGAPRYIYTDSTLTKLTISSSGTATVTAKISGKTNTATAVEVDAYLEQYSAGAWRIVDSWSKSSSSSGTTLLAMVMMVGMGSTVFAEGTSAGEDVKGNSSLIQPITAEEKEIVDQNGNLLLGGGPDITIPSRGKTNWTAPLQFVNNGQLTTENPIDMYFFTTTSAKCPMIKIESTNKDYVAQLYQYNSQTNEAIPIQFYDLAKDDDYAYAPSLPAYSFIWVVYSDSTVGENYTIMANVSNSSNPTYRGYVSPNLSETTFIYPNNVIMLNNKQVYLPSSVSWKRVVDVPVSNGYIHEEQTISGVSSECIDLIAYGKYDSTSYTTNNAVFFELKCPALLPPLDENPLWSYLYSSYLPKPNGGYEYYTNRKDVAYLETPRRLSIVDTTDYRYNFNGNSYFSVVYDLNTGKFIDFASRLNGFYFLDSDVSDNAEDIFNIRYEYALN